MLDSALAYLPSRPTLAEAMDQVELALDTLARVELDAEDEADLRSAAIHLARLRSRQVGHHLRMLEAVDRREAYRHDGAVTTASWYRSRARVDHSEASRTVNAAVRLRQLPELRSALEDGDVTPAHVTAVTDAAVPRRMAAVAACEQALVDLAMVETPWQVRRAVNAIAENADRDGSELDPIDDSGPDERRDISLHRMFEGLWDLRGTLDPVTGEKLATLLDAFDTPDPAGTPLRLRRSAGQRRADALDAALSKLLDSGDLPVVQGNKPHLLVTADLATLLGRDGEASRPPRMRYGGEISPLLARELALAAKLTVVLTMGPWRIVNVGRTHRTLPSWLRAILELVHRQCRGPDCDRRITWSQAHHETAWVDGGETDLNATIPLCQAHHDLVTTGGWSVTFDPDTGVCAWTAPDGRVIDVPAVTP